MTGAYRRMLGVAEGRPPAVLGSDLPEVERQLFRERGRRMVDCLLAHLDADAPAPAVAKLHEAADHAGEYGAHAARMGASLGEAVETFLRFRAPFIAELATTARKRGLDTREATGLLVDAETAFDKLLLAFMEGWQNG
jgi:hypothetical protein